MSAGLRLRPAVADDVGLLRDMVVAAVNWPPGRDIPAAEVLADPRNAHYADGWPRQGDLGVVAVAVGDAVGDRVSTLVGAAWLRYFTADDPGYGYVADDVPELSIGVVAGYRGRGVGTLLLERLLHDAAEAGVDRVSLSVERDNPAARLYERLGFVVHDPHEGGDSMTMAARVAHLRGSPPPG